jgi:hypothetical protein
LKLKKEFEESTTPEPTTAIPPEKPLNIEKLEEMEVYTSAGHFRVNL